MADESQEIIDQWFRKLEEDLKKQVPVATGKTRDSIRAVTRKKGGTIVGGAQIGALIDGRKPTKRGAKKGSPTLQQVIFQWIEAKSIRPRESSMSKESLSWAISQSIHKKGYRGKPDLFATVLNQNRIDALLKSLLKNELTDITSSVLKEFKNLQGVEIK